MSGISGLGEKTGRVDEASTSSDNGSGSRERKTSVVRWLLYGSEEDNDESGKPVADCIVGKYLINLTFTLHQALSG